MLGTIMNWKVGVTAVCGAMLVSWVMLSGPLQSKAQDVGADAVENPLATDKQMAQLAEPNVGVLAGSAAGASAVAAVPGAASNPQKVPAGDGGESVKKTISQAEAYVPKPGEDLSDLGTWARWCTMRQYGPSEKVKEPCEYLVKNTPGLLIALRKNAKKNDPRASQLTADDWVSQMMAQGMPDDAGRTRLMDAINVWWASR